MVVPGAWHEPHGQAGVVPGWEKTKVTYTLVLFPPNSREASSGRFIFALFTLNQNMVGGVALGGETPKKPNTQTLLGSLGVFHLTVKRKYGGWGGVGRGGCQGSPLLLSQVLN